MKTYSKVKYTDANIVAFDPGSEIGLAQTATESFLFNKNVVYGDTPMEIGQKVSLVYWDSSDNPKTAIYIGVDSPDETKESNYLFDSIYSGLDRGNARIILSLFQEIERLKRER